MKTIVIENKEQVEKIISACSICYVGMIDLEGHPYVIPMNFGYSEGIVYLHSGATSGIVAILKKCKNVCITFCSGEKLVCQHPNVACSYRMQAASVICQGTISSISDNAKKIKVLNLIMNKYVPHKQFKYSNPAVENVCIWKIPIDKVSAKEFGVPHQS